jgi:hypothetical protein
MKHVFLAILAFAFQTGCGSVYHGTFSRDGKAGNIYREETPFQSVTLETVDTTQADRNCFARMANVGPNRQIVCDEQGQGFVRETVGIGRTGSGGRASGQLPAAQQPQAPTAIAVGGMPGMPGYGFGAPVAVAIPATTPAAAAPSGGGASQGEVNKKVRGALNNHEGRLQDLEKKK